MPKPKKSSNNKILTGVILLFVASGLIWWGYDYYNRESVTPGSTTSYDYIDTTVYAINNASWDCDELVSRTWFECDISEMEDADIEALTISDFTQKSSSDAKIDIEDDTIYALKINGSLFQEKWYCTDVRVAEGKMAPLGTGPQNLSLFASPTQYAMLAYPVNMPNATTVNQSTYDDWKVNLFTIDSGANVTDKVGFEPYYDFTNARDYFTFVAFTFNTTVTTAAVQITTTYGYTKIKSSDTTVVFLLDCDYVTGQSFDFTLGSGLGTSFVPINFTTGIGYEGGYTTYGVAA